MDTYSHLVRAVDFGDCHTGELSYAKTLTQAAPDNSLTIFDRAYFSAAFLLDWQQSGQQKHWLIRARTSLRHEVVCQFAPGDQLIRLPVSPQARQQRPDLPSHWQARLIECTVGGQPRRFLTSLHDAQRFPARDIAAHYVQRWEIELGFREIKQGMLKKTRNAKLACQPYSRVLPGKFEDPCGSGSAVGVFHAGAPSRLDVRASVDAVRPPACALLPGPRECRALPARAYCRR